MENREKYLEQMKEMVNGLNSIIPTCFLRIFNCQEIEELISGKVEIDVNRLKENAVYELVDQNEKHISFFWDSLHSFDQIQLRKFLQFVWARSRLPPSQFNMKFKIQDCAETKKGNPDHFLPKAQTCFFRLFLPRYSSFEITKNNILKAIDFCIEMDNDFRLHNSYIHNSGGAFNN
jgi:hypothetical protein